MLFRSRRLSGKVGKEKQEINVPAISHEVWELDDGRIALVLVNPENEKREIPIDLSFLVKGRGDVSIREFSATGGQRDHEQVKLQVEVPALDMMLIEIR